VIDGLKNPHALTVPQLIEQATAMQMLSLADELRDRKARRAMPQKLERVGYVPVRNPDADDGLFKVGGRRQVVYARRQLDVAAQIRAARLVR
jgi:hypothetical protein